MGFYIYTNIFNKYDKYHMYGCQFFSLKPKAYFVHFTLNSKFLIPFFKCTQQRKIIPLYCVHYVP